MPEIVLGSNSSLISKADVVIAIGGGRKTYEGALAAQIANKTVILVGSFGGAGHKILQRARERKENYNIEVTGLDNRWNSAVLKNVLKQSVISKPKIFIVNGQNEESKRELADKKISMYLILLLLSIWINQV